MKQYPSGIKRNMRRRGPVESFKMDSSNKEVHANLKKLYQRIEKIQSQMNQYRNDIYEGKSYNALDDTLENRAYYIRRQIEVLERGVENV